MTYRPFPNADRARAQIARHTRRPTVSTVNDPALEWSKAPGARDNPQGLWAFAIPYRQEEAP